MPERPLRYRMHRICVTISEEEFRDLRQVCSDLNIPVRVALMIGVRRARSVFGEEQRRQRQQLH